VNQQDQVNSTRSQNEIGAAAAAAANTNDDDDDIEIIGEVVGDVAFAGVRIKAQEPNQTITIDDEEGPNGNERENENEPPTPGPSITRPDKRK